MKPEQAHFGRLYVRMFFWKDLPQTEGRRNADLLIKTWPDGNKTGPEGHKMNEDPTTANQVATPR